MAAARAAKLRIRLRASPRSWLQSGARCAAPGRTASSTAGRHRACRRRAAPGPPSRHRSRAASAPGAPGPARRLQAAGHGAGQRAQHIDRRVTARLADAAVQDDMAVQDAAHGVGHRLVVVVAFHQHGEQRGDLAGAAIRARPRPGAFQQARQFGEHAGRIAAGGRRLAAERPISRRARQNRVTLSISSSTDLPSSRKCSATVIAA